MTPPPPPPPPLLQPSPQPNQARLLLAAAGATTGAELAALRDDCSPKGGAGPEAGPRRERRGSREGGARGAGASEAGTGLGAGSSLLGKGGGGERGRSRDEDEAALLGGHDEDEALTPCGRPRGGDAGGEDPGSSVPLRGGHGGRWHIDTL